MKKYFELFLNIKTHHLQQKIYLKQRKANYDKIKYIVNNDLIKLMEDINTKKIPEKENPKKVVNIVEKSLFFSYRGLKILIPKQMLQRLPIPLAQIKSCDTSENLQMKSDKSYVLCIKTKKLLKMYTTI